MKTALFALGMMAHQTILASTNGALLNNL